MPNRLFFTQFKSPYLCACSISSLPVESPLKGSLMLKMMDVLDQSLVQNFSQSLFAPSEHLDEQFNQSVLNVSDVDLHHVLTSFFMREDAVEVASALDIQAEHVAALQAGANLKDDANLAMISKIMAFCLALETNALQEFDLAESLQDYPM